MHRVYSWPPVDVVVDAEPGDEAYRITLVADGFRGSPMSIDCLEGADHASRKALEVYRSAWEDPKRFLAGQRMEARHLRDGAPHVAWAEQVAREAALLGERLIEASRRAAERPAPVDVTAAIDECLRLTELEFQTALARLMEEGHSREEAERIHVARMRERFLHKWDDVPSLRLPTAARR